MRTAVVEYDGEWYLVRCKCMCEENAADRVLTRPKWKFDDPG